MAQNRLNRGLLALCALATLSLHAVPYRTMISIFEVNAFRVILLCVLTVSLGYFVVAERVRKPVPAETALWVLIGWLGSSILWSEYRYETARYMLPIVLYGIFVFLTAEATFRILCTKNGARNVLGVSAFIVVGLTAVIAILYLLGVTGRDGAKINAVSSSLALVFLLPVTLGLLGHASRIPAVTWLLLLSFQVALIFALQSRTAIVALGVFSVIVLVTPKTFFSRQIACHCYRVSWAGSALVVAGLAVTGNFDWLGERVSVRLIGLIVVLWDAGFDLSVLQPYLGVTRTNLIEFGVSSLKDHWLMGFGYGSDKMMMESDPRYVRGTIMHNEFLRIWLGAGIIAVGLVFVFAGSFLSELRKLAGSKPEVGGVHPNIALLFAWSIGLMVLLGMTNPLFNYPFIWWGFGIIFGCGSYLRRQRRQVTQGR